MQRAVELYDIALETHPNSTYLLKLCQSDIRKMSCCELMCFFGLTMITGDIAYTDRRSEAKHKREPNNFGAAKMPPCDLPDDSKMKAHISAFNQTFFKSSIILPSIMELIPKTLGTNRSLLVLACDEGDGGGERDRHRLAGHGRRRRRDRGRGESID